MSPGVPSRRLATVSQSVSQALPRFHRSLEERKEKAKPQTQSWRASYLNDKIGHDAALDDSCALQYSFCIDHAVTSRRLGRTTNHKLCW